MVYKFVQKRSYSRVISGDGQGDVRSQFNSYLIGLAREDMDSEIGLDFLAYRGLKLKDKGLFILTFEEYLEILGRDVRRHERDYQGKNMRSPVERTGSNDF